MRKIISILSVTILLASCSTIKPSETASVYIRGAVNKPGQYAWSSIEADLYSLITEAGGLTQGAFGSRGVRIRHIDDDSFGEIIPLNSLLLMEQGKESPLNIELSGGCVVWVLPRVH